MKAFPCYLSSRPARRETQRQERGRARRGSGAAKPPGNRRPPEGARSTSCVFCCLPIIDKIIVNRRYGRLFAHGPGVIKLVGKIPISPSLCAVKGITSWKRWRRQSIISSLSRPVSFYSRGSIKCIQEFGGRQRAFNARQCREVSM